MLYGLKGNKLLRNPSQNQVRVLGVGQYSTKSLKPSRVSPGKTSVSQQLAQIKAVRTPQGLAKIQLVSHKQADGTQKSMLMMKVPKTAKYNTSVAVESGHK